MHWCKHKQISLETCLTKSYRVSMLMIIISVTQCDVDLSLHSRTHPRSLCRTIEYVIMSIPFCAITSTLSLFSTNALHF